MFVETSLRDETSTRVSPYDVVGMRDVVGTRSGQRACKLFKSLSPSRSATPSPPSTRGTRIAPPTWPFHIVYAYAVGGGGNYPANRGRRNYATGVACSVGLHRVRAPIIPIHICLSLTRRHECPRSCTRRTNVVAHAHAARTPSHTHE